MESSHLIYGTGWYPEENDGSYSFRWMRNKSTSFLKNYQLPGKKYLRITAGHSFQREFPILEIFVNGQKKGEKEIESAFRSYALLFEERGDIKFEFRLNKTFHAPNDPRNLGIMVRKIEVLTPSETDIFLEGWYEREYDDFFPFRWMKKKANISLSMTKIKKHKYISFHIFSEFANFSQRLTLSLNRKILYEIPLLYKWNFYSFALHPYLSGKDKEQNINPEKRADKLKANGRDELIFSLNKVFPKKYHKDDPRELGIRISPMEFNDNDEAHKNFLFFHKNALLNYTEMRQGKKKLESYPLNLGVDLYGKCNIKPSCVYCLWDRMKKLEGEYVETDVDEKTLKGYGPFFQTARLIINCSFGEPLLHPRLQRILEFCENHNKILEISTNGQSFSKRTIKVLVGKPIFLYVSLDAASKETYAKIRNDRWQSIIPNLILLNQERKKKGCLPKIYMVFMPMRVNEGDLEDYFRLCHKIEADALVLRPLNYLENPQIEVERAGYHFDYKKELLSHRELEEIFRRCDEFSIKYEVPVANQFTFGTIQEPGPRRTAALSVERQRF